MSRFTIFASVIPLILAALFGHADPVPQMRPCITIGDTSVQIAATPWQSQTRIRFTDDPRAATVRVQVVDRAEAADFAIADDIGTGEPASCAVNAATRFIGITTAVEPAQPVVYLSRESGDLRIFVQSRTFALRDAAALIVGAMESPSPLATASL